MNKDNISILYVEDETNIREMLTRFLQRFCKELYVAKDGQEGLELYKEHHPDIVISDIRMPKMNGLDMSRAIKEIKHSQLILLLSAHSDSEFLYEAINIGVDAYILKPVDLDLVKEKIQDFTTRIKDRHAAQKLQESEERFRTLTQISLTGIFIYQEKFIYVNPAFCEITGYTEEELLTMAPQEVVAPKYQKKIQEIAHKRIKGEFLEATNMQLELQRKNGAIRTVKVSVATMPHDDRFAATGNMVDITDIVETRTQLKLLSKAVEQMDEMVRITDIDGNIIYINPASEKYTQFSKEETLGKNNRIFKSGAHKKEFYEDLWKTILSGRNYKNVFINKRKNGSIYYDEKIISPLKDDDGEICCFVSTSRDVSDRVELERQLKKLATRDALTGIYNRYKTTLIIEDQIKRSDRYNELFSLLMFDIDHFKNVNDTYGHDVGDYVLQELSRIVLQSIRETDKFGRWGGEEFMIIAPHTSQNEAMELGEKIRKDVQNHPFKDVEKITISIGVTQYNIEEGFTALTKRVDDALYKAKENGRNQVIFL